MALCNHFSTWARIKEIRAALTRRESEQNTDTQEAQTALELIKKTYLVLCYSMAQLHIAQCEETPDKNHHSSQPSPPSHSRD